MATTTSIRFNLKAERESITLYQIYYSRVAHLLLWVQFYFICFPIILCTYVLDSFKASTLVFACYCSISSSSSGGGGGGGTK